MLLLWKAICAAIAGNKAAIDELKVALGTPEEALIFEPLLRGLASTGQLDETDRAIAAFGSRYGLPPWMTERLYADTRLDTRNPDALRDAATRLQTLTDNLDLPLIHRAEVWHNLGVARDDLGEREAAIAAFEQACALNPYLDAAREELKNLRAGNSALRSS